MIHPQDVYDYLLTIPSGKVVTYKMIAEYLGNPYYVRRVGTILHHNPDTSKYPCYKVVNSEGKLATHFKDGIETQRTKLLNEGVAVINNQVDLDIYLWEK